MNAVAAGESLAIDLELFEMMFARCVPLLESEQRERLMSTSRQAPLGQGLSALVRIPVRSEKMLKSICLLQFQPDRCLRNPLKR